MTVTESSTPSAPASEGCAAARRRQAGPRLVIPALAFTAVTIAYVVTNHATPRPDASGAEVLRYAGAHAGTIKVGAFLVLGSAAPLAVLAAALYRRLRALGITAPGSAIALVGGVLAANALIVSALLSWTEGRLPADASPALARVLADLSFLAGGAAYAMTFGLFAAGVSVPSLLTRLLPRPLAWAGLAVGACGVACSLTLLADDLSFLLPIARFGGLVWLVLVAVLMPRSRPRRAPA